MDRIRRALVASIAALAAVPSAGSAHPRHLRLPRDYAAWTRVAICEEGLYAPGGFYPDALGINATNYKAFSGHPDYGRLTLSQRIAEIKVADRLIRYYGAAIPDQHGCHSW